MKHFGYSAFLFLALIIFSGSAVSEGGCPPGMYPPNPANTSVCYPFPEQQQSQQHYWQTRFGAIAIGSDSKNNSVMGASNSMMSRRKADKQALSKCKAKGGGKTCKISISYYNQCAVVVWGDSYYVSQGAETIELARDIATKECSAKTTNCKLYYMGCSSPVLIK
jgi:hypothetical protein